MQEIRMWTDGVPVEQDAMQQLRNIAESEDNRLACS